MILRVGGFFAFSGTVYIATLSKSQNILFSFLDDAFEIFGGVPEEIVTDNMKTVMDKARTEYDRGKINNKFQQYMALVCQR